MLIPLTLSVGVARGDDELAQYAAEGNTVGVDGQCFMKNCAVETSKCANDKNCLKGLSCLARCKGGSMCSTGCFAKYGSDTLDNLLHCSIEQNDCVQVPKANSNGWNVDSLRDLPTKPITPFTPSDLSGTWYKVMGLDSRYDCFDCQRNSFSLDNSKTMSMESIFRIPRPTFPGYLQSKIDEKLYVADRSENPLATLQSEGRMFGLTFWENWYLIGDTLKASDSQGSSAPSAFAASTGPHDLKLVYYTGHTLQGSYKGKKATHILY
jgi:hypothetical protein